MTAAQVEAVSRRGLDQAERDREIAGFAPDGNQWMNTLVNKGEVFRACWLNEKGELTAS